MLMYAIISLLLLLGAFFRSTALVMRLGVAFFFALLASHDASVFSTPSSGLSKLTVTELKRLLSERGVDFRDCLVEMRDLVEPTSAAPQKLYSEEENMCIVCTRYGLLTFSRSIDSRH
jgi:hypothetical protein